MQDVFEVVSLNRFFRIEQIQEFLHEFCRHVKFQLLHFHGLVNNELQKELINTLQVRPGRVHLFFLVNAGLRKVKIALLDVG